MSSPSWSASRVSTSTSSPARSASPATGPATPTPCASPSVRPATSWTCSRCPPFTAPSTTDLMATYSQTCPRCGEDLVGDDRNSVADAVVAHARDAHHHELERRVVLAHLEGVRPDEYED